MEAENKRKAFIIQIVLCVISNFNLIGGGMNLSYAGVILPTLQTPNNVLQVTMEQASWIVGIGAIVMPLGSLICGLIIDRFGRRLGILLGSIPFFIGWLMMGLEPALLIKLYIGRFLTGFGSAFSITVAATYTAEVSSDSLRSILTTVRGLANTIGSLALFGLAWYFEDDWQSIALVSSAVPIATICAGLIFLPESYRWLIARGRYEDACKALKTIRALHNDQNVQSEMNTLTSQTVLNKHKAPDFMSTVFAFKRPEVYKPLFIMNVFFFLQPLSGVLTVVAYSIHIVKEIGVTSGWYNVILLMGVGRIVGCVLAVWLAKVHGKRTFLLSCGVLMTITSVILAVNSQFFQSPFSTQMPALGNGTSEFLEPKVFIGGSSFIWLPVCALITYTTASTAGFLTTATSMMAEVYPTQVRGVACGITNFVLMMMAFVALKTYLSLASMLGKGGIFYTFAGISFIATSFMAAFMPETNNKSLYEIEQHFGKKKATVQEEGEMKMLGKTQM